MSKAAKGGSDKLQQKSPAEFFAENKNIAGFDNVRSWTMAMHFKFI
jgi:DNA topoisomerase VI subunit B